MHFNIPASCQNTTKSLDEKTSMSFPKEKKPPHTAQAGSYCLYGVYMSLGNAGAPWTAWSCWGLVPVPALGQLEASRASVLPAGRQNNPRSWDWVAVSCSALKQGTFELIQRLQGWAQDYAKVVWLLLGAAGKAVTFFALVTLKAAPAEAETSTKLHNQLKQLLPLPTLL